MNAQGLNQCDSVWTAEGAVQPGFDATGPATLGSPTWLGRFKLLPFHAKFTPDPLKLPLLLATTKSGNPDVAFSIKFTCQLPRMAFAPPPQSLPNRLPLPNGKS